MGWWSSDTATLYFDNCRIPADNLMGEENKGFLAIMNNFNYERYMMGAQMLGMAKRCFEECVQYSQERQTFGKNINNRSPLTILERTPRANAPQSKLLARA